MTKYLVDLRMSGQFVVDSEDTKDKLAERVAKDLEENEMLKFFQIRAIRVQSAND